MSFIRHRFPLRASARILKPGFRSVLRSEARCGWWGALATILLFTLGCPQRGACAVMVVTTLDDKISTTGGCSLQEAIYSDNFDNNSAIASYDPQTNAPNIITTQCAPGSGDDRIILPFGAVFQMNKIVDDADNPFGPTATPIVTSNITIEANGSLLQWVGTKNAPAFSVGSTGNLTTQKAYIKGCVARRANTAHGAV